MAGPIIGDDFLTVADVSELLKLNQQTIRNWIDQGSLPALRVGRRVRIRKDDFRAMLERGYTGTRASDSAAASTAEDFWSGALHPEPVIRRDARQPEDVA